jgi:hypothetical protein
MHGWQITNDEAFFSIFWKEEKTWFLDEGWVSGGDLERGRLRTDDWGLSNTDTLWIVAACPEDPGDDKYCSASSRDLKDLNWLPL